jgi:hypothetical protein
LGIEILIDFGDGKAPEKEHVRVTTATRSE